MNPACNTWLKIEHIDSQKMGLANGDVWSFVIISPQGWKEKDEVLVEPGGTMGTSTAKNSNKKDRSPNCSVHYQGNVLGEKSLSDADQSEEKPSLEENIRLNRELNIIKTYPNYVIRVTGSTKWQLYKDSGKYREVDWQPKDVVEFSTTGGRPGEKSNNYFVENKTRKQRIWTCILRRSRCSRN